MTEPKYIYMVQYTGVLLIQQVTKLKKIPFKFVIFFVNILSFMPGTKYGYVSTSQISYLFKLYL
jgi:hypothetical protein